jgi:uncharacterized protein (TIGR03083 family)
VNGQDVRTAAQACSQLLRSVVDEDWCTVVPDIDWSVSQTVAHMALGTLWYGIDLSAAGVDNKAVAPEIRADAAPMELVLAFDTMAVLLAYVVDGTPSTVRGYHPFGMADSTGFAAMGCDELLVHTDDVAHAFGVPFVPDDALAERTLRRLFPWAPGETDAWETLRWANGRAPLGDRPRLARWRWHCAPLDEWDGTDPTARWTEPA